LKVTGIRSSGTDSKVLMNDRVFRVNDVVDRSLGVRLTKVSSDSLTFTDANGAVYVKYF
jgi:ribosome-associated protein YbcJ (S4-like RNA binding protein)